MRRSIFLAALTVLAAAAAVAQQDAGHAAGFKADGVYQFGDVDNINRFNGNVVLRIPIGPAFSVSSHLKYQFVLYNTGLLWRYSEKDHTTTNADGTTTTTTWGIEKPTVQSNAGFGWLLSLGRLIPPRSAENSSDYWLYESPDGSDRSFFPTLHDEASAAGWFYTRDGSYLRLSVGSTSEQVEFPNGEEHSFDTAGRLTRMNDRYGNSVNVTYSADGLTWTISDSVQDATTGHYRTHTVHFAPHTYGTSTSVTANMVTEVDFDLGSSTAVYTFEYDGGGTDQNVPRPCLDTQPSRNTPYILPLLTSVTLPADDSGVKQQWSIPLSQYNLGDGTTCNADTTVIDTTNLHSGRVMKLTLPTLGAIGWTYRSYTIPSSSVAGGVPASGIATRQLYDASGNAVGPAGQTQWTYTTSVDSQSPPRELKNSVVDPLGNQTDNFFSVYDDASIDPDASGWTHSDYGLPFTRNQKWQSEFLSSRTFNWAGKLVRSTWVRYDYDTAVTCAFTDPTCLQNRNRRVPESVTTFDDDSSRYINVANSDYDGLGHYRQATVSANFSSGNSRTTTTNYNSSRGSYPGTFVLPATTEPWLTETYSDQSVLEGSDTAKRSFCWDGAGTMTRQRVLVGSAPGASDLITQYTIATNGDVTSEQSFGGDNQSVGSDSDLCAATLPTQPVYGVDHTWTAGVLTSSQPIKPDGTAMPFKTVDNDVDAFRGLVTTSRDISGLATSYTYDVLGRLRTITPPTDGITEYVYSAATSTAPASVDITQWNHAQMSKLAQSRVRYDGVGRVWREDMLMPDGTWSTRETLYHANGWKLSVSERVADPGSSAVAHKTSYTYDSFGRVTSMTPPDSSSHAIQNSYTGVRLVTRTVPINSGQSSTTTEEYDAQGRLASVTEASAPDGSNVTTTYTYDVGGHLASASTAAPEGTQTRSFAYDHRGFLLSEQQPEKGFNGNGTTSYSQYDARGHVGRRTDGSANGAFDLFFTYDPAERLTKVEDIDQSTLARRTVKEFSFGDTATGSAKARLATAIRHNYPADLGGDASVTESYQYGSDGRVSQRTTTVASTPSFSGATFSFSQTWNELGLPDTVTYPSTASGTSPARSVASTYTNGLLSGVTGYASSISYHANGTIDTVAHSNGMNEQTVADSSDMPRPSQIKVTGGGANWLSGTYAYDGAGNVTQIGTTAYTYDFVGRLQQWSTSGNNASSHSVVYDSFGNMLSDSTSFCAQNPDGSMRCGSSSSVPRQINGTSNHLFAVYDDAGNQLTDGGKRYAYDSSSMMTSASSGGREFRYICTADDERVAAVEIVSGGNHTTWTLRGLGNQLLREWTDDTISGTRTWSWQEDEIWRGTQLLARETPSGVQHYGLDHLGSPRVVTSGSGALVATQDFAPFGIITSSMTGEGALAFTAHERDATNLGGSTPIDLPDYMHARYYAAGLGRFLSVDPISKTAARSPQGWNRYTYSANRPLNFLDPDGRVAVGFAGFSGPNTTSYIYTINKVLRGTPGLGPTNAYSSGDIAKAVAFVAAAYTKNPHQPVVLYGHSWGGSAAVIAAEQLNRMGIPVDLLITFDAVGKYMDFGRGVLLVPPNVKIAINYYQTDPTQLGNNRLEASSELSNVFNIDIGNVKHTDVDDTMGAAAAQLIQSVALNDLFDRMYCFDGDEWLFENSFGTEIQITRTR